MCTGKVFRPAKSTPWPAFIKQVTGSELCDGTNLSGVTCASAGYGSGSLACLASCGNQNRRLCDEDEWTKTVKPRPAEIDDWTHFLHGPTNNAVADDSVVGPPRQLQWVGGPRWARSHHHLGSGLQHRLTLFVGQHRRLGPVVVGARWAV